MEHILKGHDSAVFTCNWHPTSDLLASGSRDGTTRLWYSIRAAFEETWYQTILRHYIQKGETLVSSNSIVSSVEWNCDGTILATASADGYARIWKADGTPCSTFKQHEGPIFALKWNKQSNYILSTGADRFTRIWDATTGQCIQQFSCHPTVASDVDWQTSTRFASCGMDGSIHLCEVGIDKPVLSFWGHVKEVNSIKWDPEGRLLASCSQDGTVKTWSMHQNEYLYDFREHCGDVYTIAWSPTGPGTNTPKEKLILASAGLDGTVRLWDVMTGRGLNVLTEHKGLVICLAFSPDGKFLASGSHDKCVHIRSTESGLSAYSYEGAGSISRVCWNSKGDKVGVSAHDGSVIVVDRYLHINEKLVDEICAMLC